MIQVSYNVALSTVDATANGLSFGLHDSTGRLVWNSPPLLPGSTTQRITMRPPQGTDYGLYAGNVAVLTVNNGVGVDLVIQVRMAYQRIPVQVIS